MESIDRTFGPQGTGPAKALTTIRSPEQKSRYVITGFLLSAFGFFVASITVGTATMVIGRVLLRNRIKVWRYFFCRIGTDAFLWRMREGGGKVKKAHPAITYALIILTAVVACTWGEVLYGQTRAIDSRLQAAVEKGDASRVRQALDAGANPNVADKDGYFPIHVAAREGRHGIVTLLLSKGADIKAKTPYGETPLHLVRGAKTAKLLLSRGADVNARDTEFQMTPLFNADRDVADILISKGADIEATTKEGHTPLAWSAYWDNLEKTRLLLARGARVNAGAGKTKTALHIAANWGRIELARLLIAHGADVNALDDSGWTPLHWAAFEGGPEMVRFLISRGARADARTLKAWAIFPAGSTIKDIEGGGRAPERLKPTEQLKEK